MNVDEVDSQGDGFGHVRRVKKFVSRETSCACRSCQGLTADDALPRSLRSGGGAVTEGGD